MSMFVRIEKVCLAAISTVLCFGGCHDPGLDQHSRLVAYEVVHDEFATEGISPIAKRGSDSPGLVEIGRQLFHDPRLSTDNTVSCASCHNVSSGGDDDRPVSIGVSGRTGTHNAPTVLNAGLNFVQFWDGRARNLYDQVDGPIENHVEMATTWPDIIEKLELDPDLLAEFSAAGVNKLTPDAIKTAIVAYEEALVTPGAPFDLYLQGDTDAISQREKRGYQHFMNLGCISCHQGQNVGGNMFQKFGVYENYYERNGEPSAISLGRFNVTGNPADRHVFKVPSLRNVAQTAPYFHDGSVPTLESAVEIMARFQLGTELEQTQRDEIVSFLKSLSGQPDGALL